MKHAKLHPLDPHAVFVLSALCGQPGLSPFAGVAALAEFCEMTPNALYAWRFNGIPKSWMRYFYLVFPHLFLRATPNAAAYAPDPILISLLEQMASLGNQINLQLAAQHP